MEIGCNRSVPYDEKLKRIVSILHFEKLTIKKEVDLWILIFVSC